MRGRQQRQIGVRARHPSAPSAGSARAVPARLLVCPARERAAAIGQGPAADLPESGLCAAAGSGQRAGNGQAGTRAGWSARQQHACIPLLRRLSNTPAVQAQASRRRQGTQQCMSACCGVHAGHGQRSTQSMRTEATPACLLHDAHLRQRVGSGVGLGGRGRQTGQAGQTLIPWQCSKKMHPAPPCPPAARYILRASVCAKARLSRLSVASSLPYTFSMFRYATHTLNFSPSSLRAGAARGGRGTAVLARHGTAPSDACPVRNHSMRRKLLVAAQAAARNAGRACKQRHGGCLKPSMRAACSAAAGPLLVGPPVGPPACTFGRPIPRQSCGIVRAKPARPGACARQGRRAHAAGGGGATEALSRRTDSVSSAAHGRQARAPCPAPPG